MSPASELARGVAAYGLPDATVEFPDRPLDDLGWDAFLLVVAAGRCTGHLVRAIEDGALVADERQRTAALDAHEAALAIDLVLERLLVETVTLLEAAGLRVLALKGAALAHGAYPDPALRSYGDADLLVAAGDYDAAVDLLVTHGARRRYPEPRPGFDRRFGKGVCMVMPDGYEVDLHRSFAAGPFGLSLRVDELFEHPTTVTIGGAGIRALGAEERFVHACFHAALGDPEPRLVALRDVAQLLVFRSPDVDRVWELCSRWRVGVVAQRAITLTWVAFALRSEPALVGWARSYRPSAFERRAMRAYLGPRRSYAAQTVAGLRAVPRVGDKAAYARALLRPETGYVHQRDGSYLRRLRRGVELLLQDRAGR